MLKDEMNEIENDLGNGMGFIDLNLMLKVSEEVLQKLYIFLLL